MYRQGDILLVKTDDNVSGAEVLRENGRLILAHGEATGHTHSISCQNARLYLNGSRMLLKVNGSSPIQLTHEEHASISVPGGLYHVVRQREYSPKEVKYVSD